jgi:uracil-DNA glycosylase family 4
MITNKNKALIDFYLKSGVNSIVSDQSVNNFNTQISDQAILAKINTNKSISKNHLLIDNEANLAKPNKSNALLENIDNAKSLNELRGILNNFDGCDLKKLANKTVFAKGNEQAKVMLVGEAPGSDEDLEGIPFVGQSGQLLDKMLATVGFDIKNTYTSNIIPWRPPGNRPPTVSEIALCKPFIEKHIELINPKILILVGNVAAKTLLNNNSPMAKIRGLWFEYKSRKNESIKALATYHPAYLMRSPTQKAFSWQDMLLIAKKYQEICNNL